MQSGASQQRAQSLSLLCCTSIGLLRSHSTSSDMHAMRRRPGARRSHCSSSCGCTGGGGAIAGHTVVLVAVLHIKITVTDEHSRGVCSLSGHWLHLHNATTATSAGQAPAAPAAPKELHGFELVREQFVPEYNSHVMMYRHQKTGVQRAERQAHSAVAAELQPCNLVPTVLFSCRSTAVGRARGNELCITNCALCASGAEVMSLANNDENKTFGVVLRTPVENSKGIPHILEHSVLCGSRKYPIKVSLKCHAWRHAVAPWQRFVFHCTSISTYIVKAHSCCCSTGALCGADEGVAQHVLECIYVPGPHLLPCGIVQPPGAWLCIKACDLQVLQAERDVAFCS